MNHSVFVDSSAWYALADADDAYHQRATVNFRRLLAVRRGLVTTNHIVAETYTLLRARLGFRGAQQFLAGTRSSVYTRRVFVPESWEEAVEDLLARYDDQDFSYVDATSFVTMRRLGLDEALAFDHHFAILGFTLIGTAD